MKVAWIESAKHKAILKALEPIKNGWIVGIGSGSTTSYAIKELARLTRDGNLEVSIVPTSSQIENLAISYGLRAISMNEAFTIDYAIDGADQVERSTLNAIKGGGGALLREKIVDTAARRLTLAVDETKLTNRLGRNQPVPVEVIPFAHRYVQSEIVKLGGRAKLRENGGKAGPVITDNGNFILDSDFGQIAAPEKLDGRLKRIPGLIETGLFLKKVDMACVGLSSGEVKIMEA